MNKGIDVDGSSISPSDKRRLVLHQIESGQALLRNGQVSEGELNAWLTAAELLLTQIYGSDSPSIRGLRSACTHIPVKDFNNATAMAGHRRNTLANQIKVLESLAASLQHKAETKSVGQPGENAAAPGDSKVILTWSGKTSRAIASFLHEWLPKAIPDLVPWISSEDIAKGDLWFPELMAQLGRSPACIICVTPENYRAPWVYYEAGVIAAKKERGKIYTVLFGVSTESIKSTPLEQFQATEADKNDVWRLIKTIDGRLPRGPHEAQSLRALYEQHWPMLKKEIDEALAHSAVTSESAETIDLLSQYGLSEDARGLLRTVCQDAGGSIVYFEGTGGARLMTNGRDFLAPYTPRLRAQWCGALGELEKAGLVMAQDNKRDVFLVTREGYRVGDML